jgi:alpha-L-arabinofuranosidase
MLTESGSNNVIVHHFSKLTNSKLPDAGYYELLTSSGSMQIIKKYKTNYLEENVANYGTAATVKKFQMNETIYLLTNTSVDEVKLNNKGVLKALGEKKEIAETYLKNSKLKIKSESDLIQLVEHLNSL